jgi:hypothetical protein
MIRIYFILFISLMSCTNSFAIDKYDPTEWAIKLVIATIADKHCNHKRQLQIVMDDMKGFTKADINRAHNRFPERFKTLDEIIRVLGVENWCIIYTNSQHKNIEKEKTKYKRFNP